MRSSTILLLLSAFIGLSSGTIYWLVEDIQRAQTQADLILYAHAQKNTGLLYKLIPFGRDIDRYLVDHGNNLQVRVGQAKEFENGDIRAIAFIKEQAKGAAPKFYRAELTLTKDSNSPTGYTMTKGFICKNACELGPEPQGVV